MRKLLPFFVLFVVVYAAVPGNVPRATGVLTYNTYGNMGHQTNYLENGVSFHLAAAINDIYTQDNTDALDAWFDLYIGFISDTAAVGGGVYYPWYSVATSPYQDHVTFKGTTPTPFFGTSPGLYLETTLRFDSQGWATILWEVTNTYTSPNLFYFRNHGEDNVGADGDTALYTTSSLDTTFDVGDDWAVVYDYSGDDPITGISFGRGNLLNYQLQSGSSADLFGWASNVVNPQPGETVSFLGVLAVGNHYPGFIGLHDLQTMKYRLHHVLGSERNFYNYITADGFALLGHLSYSQLFNAVNWNFISAGIGSKLESDSESRVVRLDGSIEEITPEAGVYCLFEDRVLQVNFRVADSGVVDEVVVFAREHGMSFHASLDLNGQPEFLIDGKSLQVPMSRFDGNLVTESAPFQVPFTHNPLSAFGDYHVNSLHFRDIFTVVGGNHPDFGGFFNVAVHRRASDNQFPALLNVPSHSELRDVGLGSSVVPDIWFDLSN